jgi:hypothetical protein
MSLLSREKYSIRSGSTWRLRLLLLQMEGEGDDNQQELPSSSIANQHNG